MLQIGGGMLEMCVLALLEKEDLYGYKLTMEVQRYISISESTLYPVLRRLKKEGSLAVYDQAFDGRNRRYYSLTETGRQCLEQYRKEWRALSATIEKILQGGDGHD